MEHKLRLEQPTSGDASVAARGLLDREDLLQRLDRAVTKRVTIISAPRGSGKTSRCIAIDPRDPQRLYLGTMNSGLWFSTDGGASWREAGPSIDEPRVVSVAVSRSHERSGVSVVYAGTEPSNLYRSEDGGLSWQLLPALRELPSASSWSFPPRPWTHDVRTIALHPTDPEWLAVGIELGGVMSSRDGGKTWIDHKPRGPQRRPPASHAPART